MSLCVAYGHGNESHLACQDVHGQHIHKIARLEHLPVQVKASPSHCKR